jgi:hypothetical protein
LWWRHERLHRAAVLGEFTGLIDAIREERDALESRFHNRVADVLEAGSPADRQRVVDECWAEAFDMEERWQRRGFATVTTDRSPYEATWDAMNRRAGIAVRSVHAAAGQ